MVYGFIIHTVGPGPEPCRVLYSRLFCCPLLDDKLRADEAYLERERGHRMEQITVVARQTEWMCRLGRQASGRPASDYMAHSSDEPLSLHDEDVGTFGLRPGDPFPQEVTCVWAAVCSLGFSLVCDPLDNLSAAELTLRMLVRYLVESLKLLSHSSHSILRADRIHMCVDTLMPQGHLLFLNHQAAQALEKELNNAMTL